MPPVARQPFDRDFASWIGPWSGASGQLKRKQQGDKLRRHGGLQRVRLIRAAVGLPSRCGDNHSIGYSTTTIPSRSTYVRRTPRRWRGSSSGTTARPMRAIILAIMNNSSGNTRVRVVYDPNLTTYNSGDEVTLDTDYTSVLLQHVTAIYHLKVDARRIDDPV